MLEQNFIYDFRGTDDHASAILEYFDGQYERVSFLKQVHSACCVEITSAADIDNENEADAQVTRDPKIILAVRTADCVPVLLADAVHKVVGVAHAGWKGAIGGIVDSVVKAMQSAGAEQRNITAIIGPCIRQDSYEVSEDFVSRFSHEDASSTKFFKQSSIAQSKKLFDLPGYITELLHSAGVKQVQDKDIDTLQDPRFFSYRRATKAGTKSTGRNVSFIALRT